MQPRPDCIPGNTQAIDITDTGQNSEVCQLNKFEGGIIRIPRKVLEEYNRSYGCSTKTSLHDNNYNAMEALHEGNNYHI